MRAEGSRSTHTARSPLPPQRRGLAGICPITLKRYGKALQFTQHIFGEPLLEAGGEGGSRAFVTTTITHSHRMRGARLGGSPKPTTTDEGNYHKHLLGTFSGGGVFEAFPPVSHVVLPATL